MKDNDEIEDSHIYASLVDNYDGLNDKELEILELELELKLLSVQQVKKTRKLEQLKSRTPTQHQGFSRATCPQVQDDDLNGLKYENKTVAIHAGDYAEMLR